LLLLVISGCKKDKTPPSQLKVPGYSTRLHYEELFDLDLSNWQFEGSGSSTITPDGRLRLAEADSSEGLMAWLKVDFSGSFLLEYEVEIPDTNGVNIVFFCAETKDYGHLLKNYKARTGRQQDYCQSDIYSYQVAYHCYTPSGDHENSTHLRKNPGSLLLSREFPDPCRQNRFYLIDIVKTGNRIQFFVDKEKIHDLRDRGGYGAIYNKGKIGFWIHGTPRNFSTTLDNIRVYNLIPE